MRILTQNNLPFRDLPYENVAVYIDGSGREIRALFGNVVYVIAKYSTEAKVRKAMEMLQKAYSPILVIKEQEGRIKPNIKPNDWLITPALPTQRIEACNNFYFQFPADNEVEA